MIITTKNAKRIKNMREEWTHFEYAEGNPYIAKTEKEVQRILKKYGSKVKKIKDGYYFIDNSTMRNESARKRKPMYKSHRKFTESMEYSELTDLFKQFMSKEYRWMKPDSYGTYEFVIDTYGAKKLDVREVNRILDYKEPMDAFYELLDWEDIEYRREIEEEFVRWLAKNGYEEDEDFEVSDLYDVISDCCSFHADYDFFLDSSYNVAIIIDAGNDSNYDYTINPSNYEGRGGYEEIDPDCSVAWLIEQQGHTVEEYDKAAEQYANDESMDGVSPFIKSVVGVAVEQTGTEISPLVIEASLTLREIMQAVSGKFKEIVCDKKCEAGYEDGSWGIELEKGLVLPKDVVRYIDVMDSGRMGQRSPAELIESYRNRTFAKRARRVSR